MIVSKTARPVSRINNSRVDLELDYQIALPDVMSGQMGELSSAKLPTQQQLQEWVCTTLEHASYPQDQAQLTIRVVDNDEMIQLNESYRHKQGVTNVLSFPFEAPAQVPLPLLGDVVICASVVEQEAHQQHKTLMQHWAHMVVHGVLHLLGYDHINEAQADQMEQLEITILSRLGYTNPYHTTEPT